MPLFPIERAKTVPMRSMTPQFRSPFIRRGGFCLGGRGESPPQRENVAAPTGLRVKLRQKLHAIAEMAKSKALRASPR